MNSRTIARPVASKRTGSLPVVKHTRLWHIGTLNAQRAGTNSHEGPGLSVSVHPASWRQIAQLGGRAWWELNNPSGVFLDFHKAKRDAKLKARVTDWALKKGLVEEGCVYTVSHFDDEMDTTLTSSHTDREEARIEAEAYEVRARKKRTLVPTPAMTKRSRHSTPPLAFVLDFAFAFYAHDECPALDGVWWSDQLNPNNYSAPRGVIFDRAVSRWAPKRVQAWESDDEEG